MSNANKIRHKIKAGKVKPLPAGTLSTGIIPELDMPAVFTCRGHIWEVGEPIKSSAWQSGYKQSARCLVCPDNTTAPVDSSTWIQKATKKDIERCMKLLKRESRRYKRVFLNLARRLERY